MNRITEAYKPGKDEEVFKINIPITRPGKDININKVSFDLDSYLKAMKSEYVTEVFEKKIGLPLVIDGDTITSGMIIPADKWIGKVVKWTLDNIIVEISRDNYNKYIAPFNDNTEMKAGILGYGEVLKEVDGISVYKIDKVYGFQLLYGISAKTLEKVEEPKTETPEEDKE